MLKLTERSLPAEMLRNLCGLRNALRTLLADAARRGGCARLCLGRAGVLSRLVEEPEALGKVAREALNLMHFDKVDKAIAAGDASLLANLVNGFQYPRKAGVTGLLAAPVAMLA